MSEDSSLSSAPESLVDEGQERRSVYNNMFDVKNGALEEAKSQRVVAYKNQVKAETSEVKTLGELNGISCIADSNRNTAEHHRGRPSKRARRTQAVIGARRQMRATTMS